MAYLLFVASCPGVAAAVAVLTCSRCSVKISPSAKEALECAEATPPTLVLIDAKGPSAEIIYLVEALKARSAWCQLIVTASELPTDTIRALTSRSVDILFGKPVPIVEILNRIASRLVLPPFRLSRYTAKAIQYLAEQYAEPITLRTIGGAVGVSVSHLEDRFRKELDMPVKEYLRRARVEVAKYLLRSTEHKIEAIAVQAGFSDASHLSRLFQEYAGMRPGLYRRRPYPAPLNAA